MTRQTCASGQGLAGAGRAVPLERVLFALAGSVTLLAAALTALISPWFLLLAAFVGVNQWLYALAGACPASLLLGRLFKLRSAIYPARGSSGGGRLAIGQEPTP